MTNNKEELAKTEEKMRFHATSMAFHKECYQFLNARRNFLHEQSKKENVIATGVYKQKQPTTKQKSDKLNVAWLRANLRKGDLIKVKGSKIPGARTVLVIFPDGIIASGANLTKKTNYSMHRISQIFRDGKFVFVKHLAGKV